VKVGVTAPAERGKANAAVLQLLASALGLAPSSLEIASGHATPEKTIVVPLEAAVVRERLAAALDEVRR
jgi:uncharacterized protein YggU (UPF0235/DUF167 family)